jgi:hypothetical protein
MKTIKHKSIQRMKSRRNKTKNKSKFISKVNCSPKSKEDINGYSCYTNKSLYKLKKLWNDKHMDSKIVSTIPIDIHSEINEKLSNVCNKESCWLNQENRFGKISDMKDSFAPLSPKEWSSNPNEWLSSIDILKVMKQYEKAYKCFKFIGPSPIDFDTKVASQECVLDDLCKFSVENEIKNKKTKIGIIFNTDPHNKPGEHWISMFINIKKGEIFFFNSTGEGPSQEIITFVNRIKEQGLNLNPKIYFKFDDNRGFEHQYGNTECGMYSLYFIIHMLEDKITQHYLKTHKLKDNYMNNFRKIYFNDSL